MLVALCLLFFMIMLTVALLLIWFFTKNKVFGKTLGLIWTAISGFVALSFIIKTFTTKKNLGKDDYYGEYVIDRTFFPGKQADWQYENFRFEIKENDSLFFYVTDKSKIIKTYTGKVGVSPNYITSKRIEIHMEEPTIHVMNSNPTIYRTVWSFYLVFNSEKFKNMYFKKGKWKAL